MKTYGSLAPDEDPEAPRTHAQVMETFDDLATRHFHPTYSKKHLRMLIKALRDEDGLDYGQIEEMLKAFFVLEGDFIKTEVKDLPSFLQYRRGEMVKRTAWRREEEALGVSSTDINQQHADRVAAIILKGRTA